MATKKNTEPEIIVIPPLDIKTVALPIVGKTPLIVHAWSEKAQKMMLDKQTKKASSAKEVRRPAVEFADSLYWISEKPDLNNVSDAEAQKILDEIIPKSIFGFPTTAFKKAAAAGGFRANVTKNKVSSFGAFFIQGKLATIQGTPQIQQDMVRIGKGQSTTADLRFRAVFPQWKTILPIEYNASIMSLEQLVNLFNHGGFACGVGEWRPEKGGDNGMFEVASNVTI